MNSDDEYTVKRSDMQKGGHSKEYMRNYMKDYLEKKNKGHSCQYCGGHYKTYNKQVHDKTFKHLKGLETYEKRKEEENIEKQKFTQEMYVNLMDEMKSLKELFTKQATPVL
jgi:hypothetical protein